MRSAVAAFALVGLAAASPVPQGDAVSSAVSPDSSAPAGCSPDYDGEFQIQVVKLDAKRSLVSRQQDDAELTISLSGGVLTDDEGRTGYVAANDQFQFDAPPQAGAIYTAGFSVCSNGSLAIGDDATWYQCLSGTFYNLYDENDAAQCSPVNIQVIGAGSTAPEPSAAPEPSSVPADVSSTTVPAPITTLPDGQPQATTFTPVAPVTQIPDGQVQQPTSTPAPITQIPDGQVQAPTGNPCTQIVDGQPQCPPASATGAIPSYGANTTIAQPSVSVVPATGAASTTTFGSQIVALVGAVMAVAFF